MLSNTNPDSVMKRGKEEEEITKMRRRELVPGPVCGCAMFNDFLLVYVIHYIILLLIPLFTLNYYNWRLLFWSLSNFPLFLYVPFFPLFCLLSESCVTMMSLIRVQYQGAILIINVFSCFFKTSLSSAMIGEAWMSNVKFLFHIFHLIF